MSLVHHEMASGESHFDWFLGRTAQCLDSDAKVVRSFRCPDRVDQPLDATGMKIEASSDHRWFYLQLKQPHELSQGRGLVTPIARGWWKDAHSSGALTGEILQTRWDGDSAIHYYRITHERETRLFVIDSVS